MSGMDADRQLFDLVSHLVQAPSVFGNEEEVVKRAFQAMAKCGFDSVEIDSVGNAVGVVEGKNPGPTLLFDAHLDTIDVIPREAWTRDPFEGAIDSGRLHGRGTSDMKGALGAMITAASRLERDTLGGRVVISGSISEEIVEGRALQAVMDRYPPDFVVIGESTELDLVRGGRGRAEYTLTALGRPAHASTPHLGLNAIHRMMDVIREIEAIPAAEHPVVGKGVMALTDIVSDPYPAQSVVPSRCVATFERRLIPGETRDSVEGLLASACERARADDTEVRLAELKFRTYKGEDWEGPKWFPAWVLEEEHPFLQASRRGLIGSGQSPGLASYQFCTNGAYSAGVAGVPTVGYGPSSEAHAHVIDESVSLEQLVRAEAGYRGIMREVLRIQ